MAGFRAAICSLLLTLLQLNGVKNISPFGNVSITATKFEEVAHAELNISWSKLVKLEKRVSTASAMEC